jgi:hypothetical protein
MSEDQRAPNNKSILPKKTKTAVMLMLVFEIVSVFVIGFQGLITNMECGNKCMHGTYVGIGLCLPYILATILICIKNRIAWIFSILILIGLLICALTEMFLDIISYSDYSGAITFFLPILLVIALPLIILSRDRKNYFEMLRQRQSENK